MLRQPAQALLAARSLSQECIFLSGKRIQPVCEPSGACRLHDRVNGITSRTLMRPPVVKRQTLPKSGFCQFFPLCFRPSAVRLSGNVFCLHFRPLVHPRDCTKHFLRVSRHRDGGDRAGWYSSLCPRNFSVPSYRPTQTRGCTSSCASEAQVRVRGSTRSPSGAVAPNTGVGAGVQSHAAGSGPSADVLLGVQRRSGGILAEHGLPADPLVTQ
jgi:hypothetical protein